MMCKESSSNNEYLKKLNIELLNIQNLIYDSHSLTIQGILLTNSPSLSFEENVFKILSNAQIHPFWIKKIIIPHNNYEPTPCFILQFISHQTKNVAKKLLCQYVLSL